MRECPKCGKQHPGNVSYCSDDGTRLSGIDLNGNGGPGVGSVLGSYRLLELIGEGGMGLVFLAEHTRLGRKVALKILRPQYSSNPGAINRFFGEARAVNQIKNDNIVEITDFIEKEDGDNYYIMELLEGNSLGDLLAHQGSMPVPRMLGIAMQVCGALAAVHDAGIIHRDLKSDNIYLIERGGQKDFVKLLDFGVAKLTVTEIIDGQSLHKTAEGAILGTPEYMSPEQASGSPVDYRADIYSLGVILYEMITGKKPFMAKSFGEIVIKHLTVKPVRPTKLKDLAIKLPRKLEDLILQCLEKEPENRPQGMRDIEQRLRGIGQAESIAVEVFGAGPQPAPRRAGKPIAVAAAVVILVGAGLAYALFPWSDREKAEQPIAVGSASSVEESKPAGPTVEKNQVEIAFDSQPKGAKVFQPGSDEPLGLTPVKLNFDRSSHEQTFDFRLSGYQQVSRVVSMSEDSRVVVILEEEVKPKPERRKLKKRSRRRTTKKPADEKPSKLDHGGTVDPFAD